MPDQTAARATAAVTHASAIAHASAPAPASPPAATPASARLRTAFPPLLAAWFLTRLWLVPAALKISPFVGGGGLDPSVSKVYTGWYAVLSGGSFPLHDVSWQYPPGAALPILAPGLVPGLGFGHAFIVLAALCDAAIFVLLVRVARRRGRSLAGPWLWTVGLAVLSTMPWNRFDLHVTALAMLALVTASARHAWAGRAFGAVTALAAVIKVWPALLLAGTARGRRTRTAWAAAAVTGAAVTAALALAMPNAFSFLSAQESRGIQIESVGSLPFHVARHLGWSGTWAAKDGSHEFVGPWVDGVSVAMQVSTVPAFGWLLWWRRRSDRTGARVLPDAALTATLLFVVTSRVISPQYMVWLLGLAAVCLLRGDTTQRPVALLILAACVFTTLDFPLLYRGLRDDASWLSIANLYARNLLLLAAAWLSARRLWRGTVPARRPSAPPSR
ncbi:glycosyltransferase family 87 protein [Streptomyces paromomycinus]|uniref:Membrane protein n=1 Tax=Streptomyces paromomycinus TaxID=92743 RepID=A0A401WA44_STREY|nr:glycosyltransferase family 87 protein [Streptomyces paromomycinus]GCD46178.1 membrane protein [Streptomyces paromomycinus]